MSTFDGNPYPQGAYLHTGNREGQAVVHRLRERCAMLEAANTATRNELQRATERAEHETRTSAAWLVEVRRQSEIIGQLREELAEAKAEITKVEDLEALLDSSDPIDARTRLVVEAASARHAARCARIETAFLEEECERLRRVVNSHAASFPIPGHSTIDRVYKLASLEDGDIARLTLTPVMAREIRQAVATASDWGKTEIAVAPGQGTYFRAADVVRVAGTGEQLIVTSIPQPPSRWERFLLWARLK